MIGLENVIVKQKLFFPFLSLDFSLLSCPSILSSQFDDLLSHKMKHDVSNMCPNPLPPIPDLDPSLLPYHGPPSRCVPPVTNMRSLFLVDAALISLSVEVLYRKMNTVYS